VAPARAQIRPPPWPTLEQLAGEHGATVDRIGRRILGDGAALEDLRQEVLLEAYRSLPRLRYPRALPVWLTTLTVRVARRMAAASALGARAEAGSGGRGAADVRASAEDCLAYARFWRVIRCVPSEVRAAWTSRCVWGESLAGIARRCGRSPSVVKRLIARLERELAREL
jgi:RNA polymerase sigma-70 factor (ECF subfamily)